MIASVELQATTTEMLVGDSLQLSVLVRDDRGDIMTDLTVNWGVSDSSIFSISGAGRLVALRKGFAVVSVVINGLSSADTQFVAHGLTFSELSAGDLHVCGLARAPQGASYCWGTRPVATPGGLYFSQISTGGSFRSCGVGLDGVYCWDVRGGDPPSQVPGGLQLSGVTVGGAHACAIGNHNKVYCWGSNDHGQLGTGVPGDAAVPTAVAGDLTFYTITAGPDYTCGATFTHEGYCWGGNDHGQLGRGTTGNSLSPVPIAGGLLFEVISAGTTHACGLIVGGSTLGLGNAYCWGQGGKGELGDGNSADAFAPVAAYVTGGLSRIAAGFESTCAVEAFGEALCWGDNSSGQLGTGTIGGTSPTPVGVSGGLTLREIAVLHGGPGGACGITVLDLTYCWGAAGALGTDSVPGSAVPVLIADQ